MKESKAVYVTKRDIKVELNREYQFYTNKIITDREYSPVSTRYEQKTQEVGCQYDCKRDNLICTCRNLATLRKRQEVRYFKLPNQIYAYHVSRSFTDIGVGSVKTLQRKKVKKIYLPSTDDRGVGSSDLSSYLLRRTRQFRGSSYYENKRTSSKCVGGILEYNTGCVMNEKLSPIIQTISGSTSPRESTFNKNIEIGSNTVVKILANNTTQVEDLKREIENKPEVKVDEIKPVVIIHKEMKTKTVDKCKPTEIKDKDTDKDFSSDSLVQHVHNLENPSDDKQSHMSVETEDPMENKLEREYRRIFAAKSKSRESKPASDRPIPDFKSTSTLKRRFEALRRGLVKKEDSKRNTVMVAKVSSQISAPSRKDVSINSDPPSLEGRSYSNTKTYSPFPQVYSRGKTMYNPRPSHFRRSVTSKKERGSAHWSSRPDEDDSECQGVKGMFKLWGKKFNLEEDHYKRRPTPKPSYASSKKTGEKKVDELKVEEKKEGRKFFFFKKKNKDSKEKSYKTKKGVTAGRCEVRDGLVIKIGGGGNAYVPEEVVKEPDIIPKDYEDIVRNEWLKKFLSQAIESQNSVQVRWNNKTYAPSSSTVFELMDNVYRDTGIVFRSKSQVTVHSSYKSYTKHQHVNFVHQNIEAWMIPKTLTDRPNLLPVKLKCKSDEERKDNIEVRISDQKWFIDKSKAFSHKIEVVLHSKNFSKLNKEKSSEYLRIDIPKGFFVDSSSDDNNNKQTNNQSSDEEVYKIVEYETGSDLKKEKAIRNYDIGDHIQNNIKVTVSVKESKDCDSKILEAIIKKPPVHRDVVIQGSNVYIPKRCDVIGVGIITQRDLREIRKPILKIQDDYSEDESEHNVLRPNQKKCEFAESYLQEYYRNWTPLGIDLYSWCVSDSHLRCCSENSRASFNNQGDGTKSCPNIYDDFQTSTIVSSCGASSCSQCHTHDDAAKAPEKTSWFGKFKKKQKDEAFKKNLTTRVLPKDSIEVCKKRKIYAMSMKSKWAVTCPSFEQPYSVPSIESKGAQNTLTECPKLMKSCCKPIEPKPKKRVCKKHVSLPDCDTMNNLLAKQLADSLPEGILAFKGTSGCEACKKKGSCPKHATINPQPSCEIPRAPCRDSCEQMKKPPCAESKASCEKPPSCPGTPPCRSPSCPPTPPSCPPTPPCRRKSSCPPSPPPCKETPSCPPSPRPCSKPCPPTPPRKKPPSCPSTPSCPPSPPPCKQKSSPCPTSPPPCKKPPSCPSTPRCKKKPTCPPSPPPCKRTPPCPPSPPPCKKSPQPCKKMPSPPCPPSPPPCKRTPPCPPSPPPCRKPPSCPPSPPPCKKPPPCPPSPPPCKNPRCPHSPPSCPPSPPSSKKPPPCPPPPHPCKNPHCPHSPPSCPHIPLRKPSPPSCPHSPPCPPSPPPCPRPPPTCPHPPPPCPHSPSPCPHSPPPCPHSPPPCPHSPPPPCPHSPPPCPYSPPPCPHSPPPCPHSPPPCPHSPPAPSYRPPPCRPKPIPSCPHSPPCTPPPPPCYRSNKPCPAASPTCPASPPSCCSVDPDRCPALPPPCKKVSSNICKKISPFFKKKLPICPGSPPCKPTPCKPSYCKALTCQPSPCEMPPPCKKPPCVPSPCRKFSTTSISYGSLHRLQTPDAPYFYSPIHPCPSEYEKPKPKALPCSVSPCNTRHPKYKQPPFECNNPHQQTTFPEPQCDQCRTSNDEDFPWPTKNQVSNQSSVTSLYQAKTKRTEPTQHGQCTRDCPMMPKLSCETIPSPKKECKKSCPNRQGSPRPPCMPEMQCPPPRPPSPPAEPIKSPTASETVKCRSKAKMSGLYLKMKPVSSNKKNTCSKDCLAWDSGRNDDGCISLNSEEKITIRLKKETPSTEEIREGVNIKVQDEDGMTLFERKDYRLQHAGCSMQRNSLLGDMYKASEVRRVVTNNSVQVIGADKEMVDGRSDASVANLIEIQFKLKVTQGEKTTEINIANDGDKDNEEDDKIEKKQHISQTPQEVFIVKDGGERSVDHADQKNDINIRIVIKNYKPKSGKKKSMNVKHEDYSKEFAKKISAKFHTVSTGYSDVLHDDNVFSVHRATVDLTSSVDKSKTHSNKSDEIMSEPLTEHGRGILMGSSYPSVCRCITTKMSEAKSGDAEVKSIPSRKYSVNKEDNPDETDTEKLTDHKYEYTEDTDTDKQIDHKYDTEETDTDKHVEPKYDTEGTDTDKRANQKYDTFMSTDTDDPEAMEEHDTFKEKSKSIEVIVKPHTKDEKKEMLKQVMEKAHETKTKNKNRMRKLRDMLKVILTSDSSDHDDTKLPSNDLAKDVTYASLKPNYFRDSDSMNNYYRNESHAALSEGEMNRQVVYPTEENNSECSNSNPSDILSSENETPNRGCMCSTVAARLKLAARIGEGGGCCCSTKPNMKKNEETICDLKRESDYCQYDYKTPELVDVEIQNSRYLTSKINSTNLSVHKSMRSDIIKCINMQQDITADSGVINVDHRHFNPFRKTFSPHMNHVRECEMRRLNRNTILSISDEDKIVFLSGKSTRVSAESTKVKDKKKKLKDPIAVLRASDILQSYETKKAVLEIYTEKTESDEGERLVAKLPKFVYDRENEIQINYEAMATNTYKAACKRNIVMMAINR